MMAEDSFPIHEMCNPVKQAIYSFYCFDCDKVLMCNPVKQTIYPCYGFDCDKVLINGKYITVKRTN